MERRARKAGAKTPTASQLLAKKTKPKVLLIINHRKQVVILVMKEENLRGQL